MNETEATVHQIDMLVKQIESNLDSIRRLVGQLRDPEPVVLTTVEYDPEAWEVTS
jgi:hypothetical protein